MLFLVRQNIDFQSMILTFIYLKSLLTRFQKRLNLKRGTYIPGSQPYHLNLFFKVEMVEDLITLSIELSQDLMRMWPSLSYKMKISR